MTIAMSDADVEDAVSEASASEAALIMLDPALLHSAGNVRSDLGDLIGLRDSIKAQGVLEPVHVTIDPEGGYIVHRGHRRTAAALLAKRSAIPCILQSAPATEADRLIPQISENLHREDLSASDKAAAISQVLDLGFSVTRVAKSLGLPAQEIKDARALNALTPDVKGKVADGQLSLEDAALLAEFEDRPKVYERLLKAAVQAGKYGGQYGGARWVVATQHQKDQRAAAVAEAKAKLKSESVRVIPCPKDFLSNSKVTPVEKLASGKAKSPKPFTAASHKRCGGHAALFVAGHSEPTFVCTDPEQYSHKRLGYSGYVSAEEVARREAERAAEVEFLDSLGAAAELRQEYVRTLLAGKPDKAVYRRAFVLLFGFIHLVGDHHSENFANLLRVSATAGEGLGHRYSDVVNRTADPRLVQHVVAHLATIGEANLSWFGKYRFNAALAIGWLELLVETGYSLSEPELSALAQAREALAESRRRAAAEAARRGEQEAEDDSDDGDSDDGEAAVLADGDDQQGDAGESSVVEDTARADGDGSEPAAQIGDSDDQQL